MTQAGCHAELCRSQRFAVPSSGVPDHLELIHLAASRHDLVTIDDVRALGISDHRWRVMRQQGWWVPVSPSHYRHVSTTTTLELRIRAGLGWLGRDAAMFSTTALWWLDIDVTEPTKPEFLVPRLRRSLVTGMVVHTTTSWDPSDLTRHRGLRTTTAARAIIDMASGPTTAATIERAIDSAVSSRRTSLPNLHDRLRELDGPGRHGCTLVRELLLDSGGESYLERRFL